MISCFQIPGSEWLRAQTGRGGSLRYKWSTWKTSIPILDLSHVISLTVREWDNKPWKRLYLELSLQVCHRGPKIILSHP